ncbi:class III lanthionine synthetase LanKC [Fodinicola feengrottensis]|uniref:Class III lanthionine synthetase LanKC n=2 Tax=Fodinicola feengrottensis TaxID=435914 RepID=A0ABN2G348_9ACTN
MLVDWEQMLSYMTHHPRWFENFTRRSPSSDFLRHYREIMPGGWPLRRHGYWMIAEPPDTPMPDQGWKLHVSATSGTGADTLRLALPVLRDAGVRFKFLMDPAALMEANGKSYGRGSSGKFIAVYPADEQQFHAVAEDLTKALAGFEGPYILSDRRYPGSRVVFYRYGGFKSLPKLRPTGLRELMIAEPDGTLVRDLRTPYWSMPDWADDPVARKFAPSREIDSETTALAGGRFTVESAISFSNRGGIYKGIDTEAGAEVVLREARPGVQVGPKGRDAVDLLRHEYDLLSDLADTGLFVRPISFFTQWEHAFVAQEYIEGSHIGYLSITQNPVYSLDLSPESLTEYYQRFRGLWLQVAEAVAVAHERGIVLGDLSTTNVMVTPDDKVQVIDLECAFHEGVDEGARMCTWGMVTKKAATSQTGDRRSDYYALGGVLLSCVLVCAQVDAVNRDIPRQLLKEVAADLNLPVELTSLIEDLRDEDAPLPDPDVIRKRIADIPFGTAWQTAPPLAKPLVPDPISSDSLHKRIDATLEGVVEYMCTTADLSREDRLFPSDLLVFETNPLSLAYGAYGTLYALHVLGAEVSDPFLSWALRHSTGHDAMPPGLYYGSAGVAWALSAMGHQELAVQTLRTAGEHPLLLDEPGILAGSAGHAMACLRLWRDTGLTEFLDRAREIGAQLAKTAVREDDRAHWPVDEDTTIIGYGQGASGVAMFLLGLHAATGDRDVLALGRAALDFDLSCAEPTPSGFLSFPAAVATDGKPSESLRQYWDKGTAGVLTTLLRYHHVTGDPALRQWIEDILPDVRHKFVAFPQLFHGASGIGNALLDAYEFLGDPELLGDAQRSAAVVLCNATERPEGIVFPGEQVMRESCDLASGSAGVALFLDRLRRARPGARTNPNFVLDDLLERDA